VRRVIVYVWSRYQFHLVTREPGFHSSFCELWKPRGEVVSINRAFLLVFCHLVWTNRIADWFVPVSERINRCWYCRLKILVARSKMVVWRLCSRIRSCQSGEVETFRAGYGLPCFSPTQSKYLAIRCTKISTVAWKLRWFIWQCYNFRAPDSSGYRSKLIRYDWSICPLSEVWCLKAHYRQNKTDLGHYLVSNTYCFMLGI